MTQEPPKIGSTLPMLVPQVDADGNDIAGIRMPELAVPLATYTGWNLFNENAGPTNTLSSMQGSFIPFAKTKAIEKRPVIRVRRSKNDTKAAKNTSSW